MTSTLTDRLNGLTTSVAIKAPCLVATTANITLEGEQTIDGVAVSAGDRVLVKEQADQTENGIYVADTGEWGRATDFNGSLDAAQGTLVAVNDGTAPNTLYRLTTPDPVTIGTDAITWSSTGISVSGISIREGGALESTDQDTVDFRDGLSVENDNEVSTVPLVVMKTGVVQTTRAETFDFRGPVTVANQGSNVVRVTIDGLSLIGGSTYANLYELEAGDGLTATNPSAGRGKLALTSLPALIPVAAATASAEAEIKFTDLDDYDIYVFELMNVVPATDNVQFQAEVSDDNGATFKSSSYKTQGWYGAGTGSAISSTSAITFAWTSALVGNDSSLGVGGRFLIRNVRSAADYKIADFHGSYWSSGNNIPIPVMISGAWVGGTAAINAVRFVASSGNISGTVYCYGMRTPA